MTLTIGILASTFTAIVVTKSIFDYFTGRCVKRLYIGRALADAAGPG